MIRRTAEEENPGRFFAKVSRLDAGGHVAVGRVAWDSPLFFDRRCHSESGGLRSHSHGNQALSKSH